MRIKLTKIDITMMLTLVTMMAYGTTKLSAYINPCIC